jgi:hypothetical protein
LHRPRHANLPSRFASVARFRTVSAQWPSHERTGGGGSGGEVIGAPHSLQNCMPRTVRTSWDTDHRGDTLKPPSPNRATNVLEEVMTVDERNRLQLAEAAKRILGDDEESR